MDLRQLRYFSKVVECGNVTQASMALSVAQPAVSQQIRNLEKDLGMQLLERSVRGVVPTAAGMTLYHHATELLRQADSTRDLLRRDAETPEGRVTVGMPSSTARFCAIPLVCAVRERFPGIMLELIEAPSADLSTMMKTSRLDLAIGVDEVEQHGIAIQRLLTEALYLITWPGFPVPKNPVSLAAIARMPLVLPSMPNTIRNRFEWAMREAGLSYDVCFEASSTGLLFSAVTARIGVTILPWTAAHKEIEEGKLKLSRVGHRLFERDVSLCWHDTPLISNAVLKVKMEIIALINALGKRPEWATKKANHQ